MIDKLKVGSLYKVKMDMIHFNKIKHDNFDVIEKINCPINKNCVFLVLKYHPSTLYHGNNVCVLFGKEIYGRYVDPCLIDVWFEEVFL